MTKTRIYSLLACSLGIVAGAALATSTWAEEAQPAPAVAKKAESGARKAGEAVEKAGEKTGEAIKKAGRKTGKALEKAGEKTGEALEKADEHVRKAARATGKKAHELKEKLDGKETNRHEADKHEGDRKD